MAIFSENISNTLKMQMKVTSRVSHVSAYLPKRLNKASLVSIGKSTCRKRSLKVMAVDAENEAVSTKDSQIALERSNPILAEKFAVIDTGKWECRSCGYVYTQEIGDDTYPIAAGTEFKNLPEDWRCPTCGSAQSLFQSKSREVAGFAQNQSYGLGGNALTEAQKSLLIWGSLGLGFLMFMSGYLLE